MGTKLIGLGLFLIVAGLILNMNGKSHKMAIATDFNTLTAEEQKIILHDGTERAFSGKYHDFKGEGTYICKQCNQPLFDSKSKFDSGTGWPSFDDFLPAAIKEVPDGSRTEIECSKCGGHIGHVFKGEGFTDKSTRHCANSLSLNFVEESAIQKAYLAGGCFWGVEHHLEKIPGVFSVTSGYMGGALENPTYKDVSYKKTGHAEAVEVVYDSSKVDYETIARMFFEIHDPTQVNRQGPDIGEQYRSAVYYADEKQKETTEKLISLLSDKGLKVATTLHVAGKFWPAEDYHQDYYQKTGKLPYCHKYTKRFD
jgi:peptide methionine sulfoxide reductase msrA/msrB